MVERSEPPGLSLRPQALYAACDPARFAFTDTRELADPDAPFGQARAMQALQVALETQGPGYNVFVLGRPGSGRHAAVQQLLASHARTRPTPPDLCYTYNFRDADRPRLLVLPPGEGEQLRVAMDDFARELGQAVQAAFEGEEYRARIEAIHKDYKQREVAAMQALGDRALTEGVALLQTPQGFAFAPVKDGEPMSPEAVDALPQEQRQHLADALRAFREELVGWMKQLPRLRREMQARLREANRDTLGLAAGHLIDELRQRFAAHEEVQTYLVEVLQDIVERGEKFRTETHEGDDELAEVSGTLPLARYQVNLLVGRAADAHAPVVRCDNPTHAQLVGRIDHVAHLGTLLTNFTMIRAGALHQAHGGFLLIDAVRLLTRPHAWETLKRALRSGQIVTESLPEAMGLDGGAQSMVPEPPGLSVKVVLFGEREHYEMLHTLDPEFVQLFRVAAEFEDEVARTDETVALFARGVASLARAGQLRPCAPSAVARLVEHASRRAGHARRLATDTNALEELLHEADTHAAREAGTTLTAAHVDAAIAGRDRRREWLRERLQDEALEDRLLIATTGSRVGQVNGLAVTDLSDFRFGRALRITATARLGDDKVLDIERESALGQPLHSKGVMILSSYLGARYAPSTPLSLSASLVFEQSYGAVEGDSASLAELCALLSALARVPLRQELAVTGSVNQLGAVQAVGAVNEKIEGFFDLCRARGLTGDQGVIVPAANTVNLMLRHDVVQAAAEGRFHVYAVGSVDAALELLSGIPAGETDASGRWPLDSFNERVARRLEQLSTARQTFGVGQVPRLRKPRQPLSSVTRGAGPRGR